MEGYSFKPLEFAPKVPETVDDVNGVCLLKGRSAIFATSSNESGLPWTPERLRHGSGPTLRAVTALMPGNKTIDHFIGTLVPSEMIAVAR
jgi:hypothetical protein